MTNLLLFFFSFCDNCDYKFTLLSPVEWEELGRIQTRIDAQKTNAAAAARSQESQVGWFAIATVDFILQLSFLRLLFITFY